MTSLALPTEVNGTLIGFRFPAATSSVNVAGWRFLFCDRRQARGGHVFTLTTGAGRALIQEVSGLRRGPGGSRKEPHCRAHRQRR